jgi:hypothetical protein
MPHLVLEFKADREVQEIAGQLVPSGKENLSFRMIDTDTGKVTVLNCDAKNLHHEEREPTWGETKIATETLNRTPGEDLVSRKVHEVVRDQRDKLNAELSEAKADLVVKNDALVKASTKVAEYESQDVTDGRDILASALDSYLEDLAAAMDFDRYEQGKKIYRRLTGQSWVDDGEEEGDLSA